VDFRHQECTTLSRSRWAVDFIWEGRPASPLRQGSQYQCLPRSLWAFQVTLDKVQGHLSDCLAWIVQLQLLKRSPSRGQHRSSDLQVLSQPTTADSPRAPMSMSSQVTLVVKPFWMMTMTFLTFWSVEQAYSITVL
jgi:hypothetical protein